MNPLAIELLLNNQDKIDWDSLSMNPSAIQLLKANQGQIKWKWLSLNPNPEAMELLKENQEKINWKNLITNPAIFKVSYNYNKMKKARNNTSIIEGLARKTFKPIPLKNNNESNENFNKRYNKWEQNLINKGYNV